ncbi:MAG: substrate-binding domain-containing protein [Bulleidia sp.]
MLNTKKFTAAALTAVLLAGCGSTTNEGSTAGTSTADNAFDANQEITVISREAGSGTRGAFIELTGVEQKNEAGEKVDMTTDEAQTVNSTSVVLTTVASDPYAIGYVSMGALDKTVKAVKVDGADATAENVKAGTYKLARPFNVAVKEGNDNPVVEDFMAYIMSEEGQAVISEEGYIPVDDVKPFEGTNPEGHIVVGGSSSVSPVMEKLIEAYSKINTAASIDLQTTDSTTGMTNAIEGSYDIGMASRELKDEEIAAGLVNTVIATDGIAVIVNSENPVDDLTKENIASIYTGEVISWSEIEG